MFTVLGIGRGGGIFCHFFMMMIIPVDFQPNISYKSCSLCSNPVIIVKTKTEREGDTAESQKSS